MAVLIDHAAGFDVEVIDDWLYVYGRTGFDLSDAAVTEFALRLDDALGRGTARQTRRYRDDRSADPAYVGEGGSRLRWSRARIIGATAVASLVGWGAVAAVLLLTGGLSLTA
jgi:hypothetical protein